MTKVIWVNSEDREALRARSIRGIASIDGEDLEDIEEGVDMMLSSFECNPEKLPYVKQVVLGPVYLREGESFVMREMEREPGDMRTRKRVLAILFEDEKAKEKWESSDELIK